MIVMTKETKKIQVINNRKFKTKKVPPSLVVNSQVTPILTNDIVVTDQLHQKMEKEKILQKDPSPGKGNRLSCCQDRCPKKTVAQSGSVENPTRKELDWINVSDIPSGGDDEMEDGIVVITFENIKFYVLPE